MAARFRANNDRLSYTASPPPDPAVTGLTVLLWAYLSVDRDDYSTLARFYTSGGSGRGQIATGSDGEIIALFTVNTLPSDHLMSVGAWSRVAITALAATVTLSAGPADGEVGNAVGSSSGMSGAAGITLGAISAGNGGEPFDGRLANVRVWAGALTEEERLAEWASSRPLRTAGLWADWPLDGDQLDYSGNGRHLVSAGVPVTYEEGPPIQEIVMGSASNFLPFFL